MNRVSSQTNAAFWRGVIFLFASLLVANAQFPTRLNVSLVGSHEPTEAATGYGDVWGDGNLACLGVWTAYSTFGFGIYDISIPETPQLLRVYNYSTGVGNRFEQGAIRSNILYVASWGGGTTNSAGSGLHIFSLTNPAAPALLSRITKSSAGTVMNGFDNVHTMFLERDFLYEAAHNVNVVSVKVFNISNPAAPVYVRDIVTTNTIKVHQITVRKKGNQVLLYTSGWGGSSDGVPSAPGQTDIWDVTQVGTQPAQWLGRIFSGNSSHSSWPTDDGNTLVVCRETAGGEVRLYDIANPAAITNGTPPLSTITTAGMGIGADIPHNPVVVSNFLFLSWYQNGLQIFDISDRTRPVRVGFYDTFPGAHTASFEGNWGVDPSLGFNRVLASDIQSGFYILNASAVLTPTNNYPPLIVQSPTSLTTTQTLSATFAPIITGSQLQYRWTFNGATLAGATSNSLVLNNVQSSQAGNYSVIASNATGCATSSVAVLSVVVPSGAPAISSQPQNVSVYAESPAAFTVGVTGVAPFTYQWRFNGGNIPNATNSSFNLAAVDAEQVGYYSVVVSNSAGTATSTNAALILLDSPYVSAVAATPGARSALISWTTTVPTSSQVQYESASVVVPGQMAAVGAGSGSFAGNSVLEPMLTTNHVVLLTGLLPGTRYSYQTISSDGTNSYLSGVYQFTTPSTNIIDNPAAAYTGSWTTTGTSSTDKYLANYYYVTVVPGAATATATYTPNIVTPGKYSVFVWYPAGSNRPTNAMHTIVFNGGTTNVLVNQTQTIPLANGERWLRIATGIEFAKGTSGYVRISNTSADTGKVVMADGVRFVYEEAQEFSASLATVPTWWRNFYFGGPVNVSADPDGDGYTTAQEYLMGTSPTNAGSHLEIASQLTASNTVKFTFTPLHGNRSYELLYRTQLGAPVWQPTLSGAPVPTLEGQGSFTLSATNDPQSFYRLKVLWNTNSGIALSSLMTRLAMPTYSDEAFCGPFRLYVRPNP